MRMLGKGGRERRAALHCLARFGQNGPELRMLAPFPEEIQSREDGQPSLDKGQELLIEYQEGLQSDAMETKAQGWVPTLGVSYALDGEHEIPLGL